MMCMSKRSCSAVLSACIAFAVVVFEARSVSRAQQYGCAPGNFDCETCASTNNSFECDNQPLYGMRPGSCYLNVPNACANWVSWNCGTAYNCADPPVSTGVSCNTYDFCN
jgi:hypothetical protein